MKPSIALALLALGCSKPEAPSLHVEVGTAPDERLDFSPETSLAEYVELKDVRHELRLTFAGYPASCDAYVTPPAGRPLVSVVVETPWSEPPRLQTYPWSGQSERARARPSVRIGARAFDLPPGGGVTLTALDLSAHGSVEGELAFEFPGDAERPAKSVRGRFKARLCRVSRAEGS